MVGLVHPPEQSTNFVWTMWGPVTKMLAVAVPLMAPIVAVMVSVPMLTPDTTPVEELIVECAPVSVHTGWQPVNPAAIVEESEKAQKLLVVMLKVVEVVRVAGFGRTLIDVSVGGGGAVAQLEKLKVETAPLPSGFPPITLRKQS